MSVEQFDFSQSAVPSATYRWRNVYADAPVQGSLTSTYESSFTLPRNVVMNLSRSELVFTLQALANANANQAVADIGQLPFDRVQVLTEKGLVLQDINYVRTVSRMRPIFQSYKDMLLHSVEYGAPASVGKAVNLYGVQDGTTQNQPVGRLIISDTAKSGGVTTGIGYQAYDGTVSPFEKAFGSYRQFVLGDYKADAKAYENVNYRIPLREFMGFLSVDKDLYMSSESLILRFTHSANNNVFFNVVQADGIAGAKTAITEALVGGDIVRNYVLRLCIQSNNVLANSIITQVNTSGLSLAFPMLWLTRRTTDTTTNHSELVRLNISKGKTLQRLVYWLERDAVGTGFANTSNNTVAGVGARWSQIRTAINSIYTSDAPLSTIEAYDVNKKFLKDSCVVSKEGFDRLGCYIDDFTSSETPDEFARRTQDACGLSLVQPVDILAEWTKTGGAGSNMNVYTLALCQKEIRLTASGVMEI